MDGSEKVLGFGPLVSVSKTVTTVVGNLAVSMMCIIAVLKADAYNIAD